MIWQNVAEEQARIIDELTDLCKYLVEQLSRYQNIEAEEERLRKTIKEDKE